MPIYEYHCEKCGEFDVIAKKITANPLRKCPTCKSKVKKLMSNTAFQLKGTGWYVTDYGNKASTNSSEKSLEVVRGRALLTAVSSDSSPSDISSSDSSSSTSGGSDTKSEGKSKKKSKGKGKGESAAA